MQELLKYINKDLGVEIIYNKKIESNINGLVNYNLSTRWNSIQSLKIHFAKIFNTIKNAFDVLLSEDIIKLCIEI